jgi:hypothetical protein
MMSVSILAAAALQAAVSTPGLVKHLQSLFGPLFLGLVGIVALFFLFTREIAKFVQFILLAVAMAMAFCTPGITWNSDEACRIARLRPAGSDAH